MTDNEKKYADIIHLPHHVSRKRPQMPMKDRAAQFSPFAALTGHNDAIRETARQTETAILLDEEALSALDFKLQLLAESTYKDIAVSVTYFEPDSTKDGGAYITASGTFEKIDITRREMLLRDGTVILLDNIADINADIFPIF